VGGRLLGVIDLIRDRPGLLSGDRLKLAEAIADVAAGFLVAQVDGEPSFDDNDAGLSSYRLEVHQASGMVSVQLKVSPEDAVARIRAKAFSEGRPISELAADIVSRRLRFGREDDELTQSSTQPWSSAPRNGRSRSSTRSSRWPTRWSTITILSSFSTDSPTNASGCSASAPPACLSSTKQIAAGCLLQ
jgi:hypothetical protein